MQTSSPLETTIQILEAPMSEIIPATISSPKQIGIEDIVQSNKNTQAGEKKLGLIAKSGNLLPLKSVFVKAKILDLASEVVILQQFRNDAGT